LGQIKEKYGIEVYLPDYEEQAIAILVTRALRGLGGPEASVVEEEAYGLPEYSLYWGPDIRSFTGRWVTDEVLDLVDPCWAFIHEEELCERVRELTEKVARPPPGTRRALAVWRGGGHRGRAVIGRGTAKEKEEVHRTPTCPTCLEKAVERLCSLPGVDVKQCKRALELFAEGKISAEGLVLLFRDRWGVEPHEIMRAFG